jgi:hypothetical protein
MLVRRPLRADELAAYGLEEEEEEEAVGIEEADT